MQTHPVWGPCWFVAMDEVLSLQTHVHINIHLIYQHHNKAPGKSGPKEIPIFEERPFGIIGSLYEFAQGGVVDKILLCGFKCPYGHKTIMNAIAMAYFERGGANSTRLGSSVAFWQWMRCYTCKDAPTSIFLQSINTTKKRFTQLEKLLLKL